MDKDSFKYDILQLSTMLTTGISYFYTSWANLAKNHSRVTTLLWNNAL